VFVPPTDEVAVITVVPEEAGATKLVVAEPVVVATVACDRDPRPARVKVKVTLAVWPEAVIVDALPQVVIGFGLAEIVTVSALTFAVVPLLQKITRPTRAARRETEASRNVLVINHLLRVLR